MGGTDFTIESSDEESPLTWGEKLRLFWSRNGIFLKLLGFVLVFLIVYFSKSIFIIIESGSAGVLFQRFAGGTQTNWVYGEGMHITAPWNKVTIYDVRVQQAEHKFSVISSNGLNLGVTISIRYRPKKEWLGVLHKELGADYLQKIVIPEVQALIRDVFSEYSPEELYSTKPSVIQGILSGAAEKISDRYITLDNLLIVGVTLPETIQNAIESKLREEQKSLEMRFRLEREKQEKERKLIEANGASMANLILNDSLTEAILRYRGIEATLELAKSENAKLVIIGSPDRGLPLIMDAGFSASNALSRTNIGSAIKPLGTLLGNAAQSALTNVPGAFAAKGSNSPATGSSPTGTTNATRAVPVEK